MAYDDDDLFDEEFDFVDEDDADDEDSAVEPKEKSPPKPKKQPAPRGKAPARPTKRAKSAPATSSRKPASEPVQEPTSVEPESEFAVQDTPLEEPAAPAEPAGPPADHVVHIYEYGDFKRTIDRKFTDEEAVGFAEEYTRTGKPYGRYAVATPDDEEPAATFAGAAKG